MSLFITHLTPPKSCFPEYQCSSKATVRSPLYAVIRCSRAFFSATAVSRHSVSLTLRKGIRTRRQRTGIRDHLSRLQRSNSRSSSRTSSKMRYSIVTSVSADVSILATALNCFTSSFSSSVSRICWFADPNICGIGWFVDPVAGSICFGDPFVGVSIC